MKLEELIKLLIKYGETLSITSEPEFKAACDWDRNDLEAGKQIARDLLDKLNQKAPCTQYFGPHWSTQEFGYWNIPYKGDIAHRIGCALDDNPWPDHDTEKFDQWSDDWRFRSNHCLPTAPDAVGGRLCPSNRGDQFGWPNILVY